MFKESNDTPNALTPFTKRLCIHTFFLTLAAMTDVPTVMGQIGAYAPNVGAQMYATYLGGSTHYQPKILPFGLISGGTSPVMKVGPDGTPMMGYNARLQTGPVPMPGSNTALGLAAASAILPPP